MKKYFFFLLLLTVKVFGQAVPAAYPYPVPLPTSGSTPGTSIKVTGIMNPTGYGDNRPVVWDAFVGGGYRSVSDSTERDAILAGRRKEGMLVNTINNGHIYQLAADLTTWVDLGIPSTWGSGGGAAVNIYNSNGTLTADRIVTGGGYSLSITNANVLAFSGTANFNRLSSSYSVNVGGYADSQLTVASASTTLYGQGIGGLTLKSGSNPFKVVTPTVTATTATVGQYLRLNNVDGTVDFATAPNIYNSDGTLTANRTITGGGYNLIATNVSTLALSAASSVGRYSTLYSVNVNNQPNAQFYADTSGTVVRGYGVGGLILDGGTGSSVKMPNSGGLQLVTLNVTSAAATVGQYLRLTATNGSVEYASIPASSTIVPTIADLVALSTSAQTITNATTLGYWAAGDGGGASYYWVNNQTSTNRGAKIASSVSGSWVLIDQSKLNVLQWGVKPDGATAASSRINEAIAYAVAQTVVPPVVIPSGNYALDDTLYVRGSNLTLDIYGKLKNINNNAKSVIFAGPSTNLVFTAGVVSDYPIKNLVVDGHGQGILDQNSQSLAAWDYATAGYNGYHTFYTFGVDGLKLRDMTLTNGVIFAASIEVCKNFEVSGCKVYNGLANNRLVNGLRTYLGGQDGIHPTDSKDGFVHHNVVISGDDAIAVSAARTIDAGNIVVSDNKTSVRVFAYEADGTTLNTNSYTGRFGLAVYNNAISAYCGLTNVVLANNIIHGGTGLFYVGMESNNVCQNVPTNIKFVGNTFSDQNSIGLTNYNTSLLSSGLYPVNYGWVIHGCENVEFIGNNFHNIARSGRIGGGTYVKSGTVAFRNNKFSNFKPFAGPYKLNPAETEAVLWMTYGTKFIVEGNTFQDNDIMPVYVGTYGDATTNLYSSILFNNNVCLNNNLRWASATPNSTNYSAALYCNGANYIECNNNNISTNYGHGVFVRYMAGLTAKNNTIQQLGNGSFTGFADAFRVWNGKPGGYTGESALYVDIQNNNVKNIDGSFFDCYNPGIVTITGNNVNGANRSYNTGYAMYIRLQTEASPTGTLNDPAYKNFGGSIFANTLYRSTPQSVFYLSSTLSTAGYTGYKLIYTSGNNAGNYTGESVTPDANGLH